MKLNNVLDELSHVFATRWVACPGWGRVSRAGHEPWAAAGLVQGQSECSFPTAWPQSAREPAPAPPHEPEEKKFWPDSHIESLRREHPPSGLVGAVASQCWGPRPQILTGGLALWDTAWAECLSLCPQLPATHRGVCQTDG